MSNNSIQESLISESKDLEIESIRNAQGHFCAARRWAYIHQALGIPTVLIAAITSASAFSKFDEKGFATGVLALLTAALTALMTFLNPGEKSQKHLNAGNRFDIFIKSLRYFYNIEIPLENQDQKNAEKMKEFITQREKILQESLQIPGWAFRMADDDIKNGKSDYVKAV